MMASTEDQGFGGSFLKAEKLQSEGMYQEAVLEHGKNLEGLLRFLYRETLSFLGKEEAEKIRLLEKRIGGNKKTADEFGLGQLIGLFCGEKQHLLRLVESRKKTTFRYLNCESLNRINELRKRCAHPQFPPYAPDPDAVSDVKNVALNILKEAQVVSDEFGTAVDEESLLRAGDLLDFLGRFDAYWGVWGITKRNERDIAAFIQCHLAYFMRFFVVEKTTWQRQLGEMVVVRNYNLTQEEYREIFEGSFGGEEKTECDLFFFNVPSEFGHYAKARPRNFYVEIEMRHREGHAMERLRMIQAKFKDREITLLPILVHNNAKIGTKFSGDICQLFWDERFEERWGSFRSSIRSIEQVPGAAYDDSATVMTIADISTKSGGNVCSFEDLVRQLEQRGFARRRRGFLGRLLSEGVREENLPEILRSELEKPDSKALDSLGQRILPLYNKMKNEGFILEEHARLKVGRKFLYMYAKYRTLVE